MTKLTDRQLVILNAAAARDDRAVLPLPDSLSLNVGAATLVLKSLLRKGLVGEQPIDCRSPAWRRDEDSRFGLFVTDAGLRALNIETGEAPALAEMATEAPTPTPATITPPPPECRKARKRGSTKIDATVQLLARRKGATIADIMEVTGWQAHSVRGAIAGAIKKKLGHTVISEVEEKRGRVYRIVGGHAEAQA